MALGSAIILAAGKGSRMKSKLPKVLHSLGGKHMVEYVIDALQGLAITKTVVVVGHGAELVKSALGERTTYALQKEQLGTGHGVMTALPYLEGRDGHVLVICGDTPLIKSTTLKKLWQYHLKAEASATVLSTILPDPTGYGRVIKEGDRLIKIVEEKDGQPSELKTAEINSGTYIFNLKHLREAIYDLKPDNAQGEYYLTDVIAIFVKKGLKVNARVTKDYREIMGINSRVQLSEAEQVLRERKITSLMEEGVTIIDPTSTFIEQDVQIGQDSVVEPLTFIRGKTVIGEDCQIGPGADIADSRIGKKVKINRAVIVQATIGDDCIIGPYAYLRPGAKISDQVKIGDFVEIKNSRIDTGSKVPHLTYIGDAEIGKNVNIGCGTITCNYDGKYKYRTIINDQVFVGSNTNLVAPVEIGQGVIIGAGSTITKEVLPGDLAIARGKQVNYEGWAAKKRSKWEKK